MGDWKTVLFFATVFGYALACLLIYGKRAADRRPRPNYAAFRRDRSIAVALAFLLGGLGAHKFYLGRPGAGVAYAVLCWTFIPTIAALFEALFFLGMSNDTFDGLYNEPATGM